MDKSKLNPEPEGAASSFLDGCNTVSTRFTPASSTADYLSSAGMSALNQPITGSQSFMTEEEKAKTSRELK